LQKCPGGQIVALSGLEPWGRDVRGQNSKEKILSNYLVDHQRYIYESLDNGYHDLNENVVKISKIPKIVKVSKFPAYVPSHSCTTFVREPVDLFLRTAMKGYEGISCPYLLYMQARTHSSTYTQTHLRTVVTNFTRYSPRGGCLTHLSRLALRALR
jgi:hypothetical protein